MSRRVANKCAQVVTRLRAQRSVIPCLGRAVTNFSAPNGTSDSRRSTSRRSRPSDSSFEGKRSFASTARELQTCLTTRSVAANLFFSFGTVDDQGEVSLQPHDLRRMLQSMGVVVSEDKLSQMVARADKASTGYISECDFLEAFDWLMSQGQDERDYMAIFNMLAFVQVTRSWNLAILRLRGRESIRLEVRSSFHSTQWRLTMDRDKNGYVEVDELTNLLSTTKERLTFDEARSIVQVADKKGDGRMNYEEFLEMMTDNMIMGWKLLTTFRVIFVMGGPASGKGTVCAELVKRSNSVHVSSGDLLRREVQRNTPLGLQVAAKMKRGELVDASTVLALLERFLTQHPGKFVLLDGFPRSLDNARDWARLYGRPEACVRINCPDEVMAQRIVERGKGSRREDDHAAAAKLRIQTYHQQSAGPTRYFDSIGLNIIDLDGTRPWKESADYLLGLPMLRSICYKHVHEGRKAADAARRRAS